LPVFLNTKSSITFEKKHLYSESSEDSNLSIQLSSEVGKRIKESMVRFLEEHK